MDKVDSAFIDSKYEKKSIICDFDRYHDVQSETKNTIIKEFKDLIEDQYYLATTNRVLDADRSDIIDINSGDSIISLTRDNLT